MRIAALIIICVIVLPMLFVKKTRSYTGVAWVLNPCKIKEPLCKDQNYHLKPLMVFHIYTIV